MSKIQHHQVKFNSPFDLDVTVDSWIYPDIQPTPEVKKPGDFARCFPIAGQQIPVRVLQLEKGKYPILEVHWPTKWNRMKATILSFVEWLLGWDIDTKHVLTVIRQDKVISHLAEPLEGLRPFSQPSLFEALVKAILQQQVSYRSANQVTRQFVLSYGPRCYLGDLELYGFPTPTGVAHLTEADLRACKTGFKAPYLYGLFQRLHRCQVDLDNLVQKETNLLVQELDALPGVGVWTAELTVLTGLRRLGIFPADDLGVRQLISKLYLSGKPAKRKDVEWVAQRWGNQAPLVLYFLMGAQVLGLL